MISSGHPRNITSCKSAKILIPVDDTTGGAAGTWKGQMEESLNFHTDMAAPGKFEKARIDGFYRS